MNLVEWSEPHRPNESCSYDHVIGITVFGRILITWKSWKEPPSFDIEEFPNECGDLYCKYPTSVEDAKRLCEEELHKMITSLGYTK